ncbi:MAG: exodeoxyribonuclease V subunit alpha [Janthinobacterium lividum]
MKPLNLADDSARRLNDTDIAVQGFQRTMEALAGRLGASATLASAAAALAAETARATLEGNVCLPLAELAARLGLSSDKAQRLLDDSGLGCDGQGPQFSLRPLVVDPQQRVYLARYYEFERRLARDIVDRTRLRRLGLDATTPAAEAAEQAEPAEPAAAGRDRLAGFFGMSKTGEIDWQQAAAALASQNRLTIISGGPGTGKTTTIAGLLGILLDAEPNLRIALAAPTGKAAQRMREALLERARHLPPALAARLPASASTLHRLLDQVGRTASSAHRRDLLPYDVVVVDEASMLDLAMAERLFRAVPKHARLILLGDKDQLAAVEAGAVFGELSRAPSFSAAGQALLASLFELPSSDLIRHLPHATANADNAVDINEVLEAAPVDALTDCVVWLERNYRFGTDTVIGALARAVRDGHVEMAFDCLVRESPPLVRPESEVHNTDAGINADAVDPRPKPNTVDLPQASPSRARWTDDAGPTLTEVTLASLAEGFAQYAQAIVRALSAQAGNSGIDPAPLFDSLGAFRVLCAVRTGARGVAKLNEELSRRLAPRMNGAGGSHAWFVGKPVMVTRNDYHLKLFNGDIGIVLPSTSAMATTTKPPLGNTGNTFRVVFPSADAQWRTVSPVAMPPHETAFAMTVHKSQGSEFDRVALVLPADPLRALSRELIYTAVTRARTDISLIGSEPVLRQAIAAHARRDAGLLDRLREAWREPPLDHSAP